MHRHPQRAIQASLGDDERMRRAFTRHLGISPSEYRTVFGLRVGSPPATMFSGLVAEMRQALTFLATFENDDRAMKTLAVISILALLTISGAAYTDQLLTGDQQTKQGAN